LYFVQPQVRVFSNRFIAYRDRKSVMFVRFSCATSTDVCTVSLHERSCIVVHVLLMYTTCRWQSE
jgi:hypothetical protein